MLVDNGLLQERWPAFSNPKDDELLSSWLVRLAMSHGLKLHTFCSIVWPGKAIWNRDIDKLADKELLDVLLEKTGVLPDRVRATTLAAYEGWLYEKHNPYGNTLWVMPVGVYHRTRKQFGLQFCPLCLAEDKEPYFRRKWRLAFITLCCEHKVVLLDRCPRCGSPINFHRNEMGDRRKIVASSITLCYSCLHDLREVTDLYRLGSIQQSEIDFQYVLMNAVKKGWMQIREGEIVYSHLYFIVLHQLMRVLATGKKATVLREAVGRKCSVDAFTPTFQKSNRDIERLPVDERRMLVRMAWYLLKDWPQDFVAICSANNVWSAALLRDLEVAPFWYWNAIHEHLYRISYRPSDEEIDSAVNHIRKNSQALNKKTLSQWLGVTAIQRKRKVWKTSWD
jgi:hypothetical protein